MMNRTFAFVGLGSNLAQPVVQVRQALQELDEIPRTALLIHSDLYRSAPLGPTEQPDFINAVAKLATGLSASHLLAELLRIEYEHGRIRKKGSKWGPRELDLDLLLYGETVSNDHDLTLPHPGISERIFVLEPLMELEPELVVPGHGTVASLRAQLGNQQIEKLKEN